VTTLPYNSIPKAGKLPYRLHLPHEHHPDEPLPASFQAEFRAERIAIMEAERVPVFDIERSMLSQTQIKI